MQPFMVGITKEDFDSKYQNEKGKTYPELDDLLLTHLHRQYGTQAFEILEIIKKNPKKGVRFIEENEFIPAEIEWVCNNECAPTLLDIV